MHYTLIHTIHTKRTRITMNNQQNENWYALVGRIIDDYRPTYKTYNT